MDKNVRRRTYLVSTAAALGLAGCSGVLPGSSSEDGSDDTGNTTSDDMGNTTSDGTDNTSSDDTGSMDANSEFQNGNFETGTENGQDDIDLPGWDVEHSNTHYVGLIDDGIDGQSIKTKWKKNSLDADPASVSQDVDLTDATGVRIDVAGKGGYPQRNKIVLEVDGKEQGTFVRGPENETEYLDRDVTFSESYEGTHTVTVKWVQIAGDNLGGSVVDNVRLLTE